MKNLQPKHGVKYIYTEVNRKTFKTHDVELVFRQVLSNGRLQFINARYFNLVDYTAEAFSYKMRRQGGKTIPLEKKVQLKIKEAFEPKIKVVSEPKENRETCSWEEFCLSFVEDITSLSDAQKQNLEKELGITCADCIKYLKNGAKSMSALPGGLLVNIDNYLSKIGKAN